MSRRAWLLFGALSLIWGVPYLLIRVAVREMAPSTLVFFRVAPVALILLPFAIRSGRMAELARRWRALLAYTLVEIMLPWLALFKAEERLTSSLAGLLVAAVPLVGALASRLAGDEEQLDRLQVAGLFIGFGGVAVLVGVDVRGATVLPMCAMAVTVLGYAMGPRLLNSYLSDLPGIVVVAGSTALAALVYAPFAFSNLPARLSGEVLAALLCLALVPTLLGFLIFFALINEIGPVRMTVVTYINPAVALVLGVALLNEPFTLGLGLGFPLVIAGSVLSARRRAPAVAPAPAGAAEA